MVYTFKFYIIVSSVVAILIFVSLLWSFIYRYALYENQTQLNTLSFFYYSFLSFVFTVTVVLLFYHKFIFYGLRKYRNTIQILSKVLKGELNKPYGNFLEDFEPLIQEIQDELKIKSETIQESNYRQKNITKIINSMEDGLILLDKNFNILLCNRVALDTFDITRKKKGRSFLQLYRNEKLIKALRRTKKSNPQVLDIEKESETYRLHINVADGGYTVFSKNVTEIIRLEQLQKEFSANVSHALRTPVTSIIGFAELINIGMVKEQEKITQYTNKIYTEAQKLINLIDDIIHLSHMESEEKIKEKVQVLEVVENAISTLESEIHKKEINIKICGNGNALVKYSHMAEIVTNLLDNAVKYNKQGGEIFITIEEVHDNKITPKKQKSKLRLTVKDTGIGIENDKIPFIFGRFYRVSSNIKGNGIGLSIVETIIKLYKGAISVESDETGTTFLVEL